MLNQDNNDDVNKFTILIICWILFKKTKLINKNNDWELSMEDGYYNFIINQKILFTRTKQQCGYYNKLMIRFKKQNK